jgi:hypothetical protein
LSSLFQLDCELLSIDGAWLKHDAEAVGSLKDDVSLQTEVFLRHGTDDPEVPKNGAKQNFQLQHRVLSAYTTSWSRAKRDIAVIVTACSSLGQEVVGIELLWVVEDVWSSVDLEGANDDSRVCGDGVVLGDQLQVLVDFSSDEWNWWVHSQSLHDDSLEILHLDGVSKGGFTVRVTKDRTLFLHHSLLDVLVNS